MQMSTREVEGMRLFFADDDADTPVASFEYATNKLRNSGDTIMLKISPTCLTLPKVVQQMIRTEKRMADVLWHKSGDKSPR